MILSLPANGNVTSELAQAAALKMVNVLAILKNVCPTTEPSKIAQSALEWMGATEAEKLTRFEPAGVAALNRTVNRILDMIAIGQVTGNVRAWEGEHDTKEQAVLAVTDEIVRGAQVATPDKTCVRWPNITETVDGLLRQPAARPAYKDTC